MKTNALSKDSGVCFVTPFGYTDPDRTKYVPVNVSIATQAIFLADPSTPTMRLMPSRSCPRATTALQPR